VPNYVRWRAEGASYFFTVVTYRRRRIFDCPDTRNMLGAAFRAVMAERPFEMFACVLLPDHLHCLWTLPDGDDDYSNRWSAIKREFSQRFVAAGGRQLPITANRRRHREFGVWQPRFWEHRIRDEREWYAYRDYIHLNPVKHGYVERPEEWKWSSIHRQIRLGWLNPGWPGSEPPDLPDVKHD